MSLIHRIKYSETTAPSRKKSFRAMINVNSPLAVNVLSGPQLKVLRAICNSNEIVIKGAKEALFKVYELLKDNPFFDEMELDARLSYISENLPAITIYLVEVKKSIREVCFFLASYSDLKEMKVFQSMKKVEEKKGSLFIGLNPLVAGHLARRQWVMTENKNIGQLDEENKAEVNQWLSELSTKRDYPLVARTVGAISYSADEMEKAVQIVKSALSSYAPATIVGDYDVDGIVGVALLLNFWRGYNPKVGYYIPNRLTQGYGLSKPIVEDLAKKGTKLLVTVDNGSTAAEAVYRAEELGMEVIILDHHLGQTVNPTDKVAVVNSNHLCGAGVAGEFIKNLGGNPSADLLATATLADMVPLTGLNRQIVKHGLANLENQGLKAMLGAGGYKTFSEEVVQFDIAPKLNAAGRIGEAEDALNIFFAKTPKLQQLAERLNEYNAERKAIERAILESALDKLEQNLELLSAPAIILWDETWHPGVIGIVASRLLNLFGKPVILFAVSNGNARGSGRAPAGYHLFNNLLKVSEYMKFGGHAAAAGCRLNGNNLLERLKLFREKYLQLSDPMPIPVQRVDFKLANFSLINLSFIEALRAFAPYGQNFPAFTFMLEKIRVAYARLSMNRRHLILGVEDNLGEMKEAIYWRGGEPGARILYPGDIYDVVFSVSPYPWREKEQMQLLDIRESDNA